jgi:hypothetical protein
MFNHIFYLPTCFGHTPATIIRVLYTYKENTINIQIILQMCRIKPLALEYVVEYIYKCVLVGLPNKYKTLLNGRNLIT